MPPPKRGDEKHPVLLAETDYAKFIQQLQGSPPRPYAFDAAAADVRKRVLDRLFELEQVEGFSSALIGAIGKLKGYYARLALVLHAAGEHAAIINEAPKALEPTFHKPYEAAEQLCSTSTAPHLRLVRHHRGRREERETVRAIVVFTLATEIGSAL